MKVHSNFLSLAPLLDLAIQVRELARAVDHPVGSKWLRDFAAELNAHAEALEGREHALQRSPSAQHRAA
jgi:hypothetical protein